MKNKETLEEAAERLYPLRNTFLERFKDLEQKIFIEGAKWQQEQYTIEEQHVGHTIDELDKEYIKGFNEGSAYYIERMYSKEDLNKHVVEFLEWREEYFEMYHGNKNHGLYYARNKYNSLYYNEDRHTALTRKYYNLHELLELFNKFKKK